MVAEAEALAELQVHFAAVHHLLADIHLAEILEEGEQAEVEALPRVLRIPGRPGVRVREGGRVRERAGVRMGWMLGLAGTASRQRERRHLQPTPLTA